VLFGIPTQTGNTLREIYVYRDEVGCFVGREWLIWEAPDYSTSEELCDSFMMYLRKQIKAEVKVEEEDIW